MGEEREVKEPEKRRVRVGKKMGKDWKGKDGRGRMIRVESKEKRKREVKNKGKPKNKHKTFTKFSSLEALVKYGMLA